MLLKFLKVFYNATLKLSSSFFTTSNLVFHEICRIQNCMQLNASSGISMLSTMANNMKAKFDKYWGSDEKNNNFLLCIVVVLDPRYKRKCLTYCWNGLYGPEIARTKTTIVEDVLRRIFHEYNNCLHGSSTFSASIGVSASSA